MSRNVSWRWLRMGANSAAFNMAADDMLLRRQSVDPRPTVRVYEWDAVALTCGYFQELPNVVNVEGCRAAGIDLARRPTGGGVVVHEGAMTFSAIFSPNTVGIPNEAQASYRRLAEVVSVAFHRLGATTEPSETCLCPDSTLPDWCLLHPVEHDVIAGGRKVAGAAQRRTKAGVLHQAYVFGEMPSQATLDAATTVDLGDAVGAFSRSLSEVAGKRITLNELADALRDAFESEVGAVFDDLPLTDEEIAAIDAATRAVYESDDWRFGDGKTRRRLRKGLDDL
ncbi:MAG: biotin/lipoate A/B protein ligase family protein [Candidatus Poribacteria bacterium]|nr:biotin/lipoate A/B protein ligase family protein [Candidatus Poribacteria bacterium]